MEIALNSIAASSSSQITTTTPTLTSSPTALSVPSSAQKVTTAFAPSHISTSNGICNNFVDHEYQTDNVNGLALLASYTLQKVLNINNINNKNVHQTPSNTARRTSTALQQQQKLITAIEYHKENISINDLKSTDALEVKSFTSAATSELTAIVTQSSTNSLKKNGVKLRHSTATLSASSPETKLATTSKESFAVQTKTLSLTASSKAPSSTTATATTVGAAKRFSSALLNTSVSSITPTTGSSSATGAGTGTSNGSAAPVGSGSIGKNHSKIPSDILDDLASRFIINVPDIELTNMIRICFQIELAHWFYLDFFCAVNDDGQTPALPARKLQPVGIKNFAMQLFQHIPFLRQHAATADQILDDWKNYKLSVPTYGAILISDDLNHCLLVQSYFAKSSWGFPKGKINENEDPVHCATREVYEETGYDITHSVLANDFIDAVINYQYTRLYIIRNVPMDTNFMPRTRNEIKCCDWFRIDSLPINKNDAMSKTKLGMNANSFFMIMPFIKRLKKWVNERRSGTEVVGRRRKCSSNGYGGYNSSGVGQLSPKANSPTNFNQKSGSSKKKHNNITGGTGSGNCNTADEKQTLNTSVSSGDGGTGCGANARSKRQRHKSMGDLDAVKLNNLQQGSDTAAVAASNATSAVPTLTQIINNQKRNAIINKNNKASAFGHPNNANVPNVVPGAKSATAVSSSTKRQLFHSQSQNDAQTNEKVVSSFDLIRKEKQQIKAASKAQKQQLQQQQGERIRAKSQSDKNCAQQQQMIQVQQMKYKNNANAVANGGKQQQQQDAKMNSGNTNNLKNVNANGNNNVNGKKIILKHTSKSAAFALMPENTSEQQQQQQLAQLQFAGNMQQKPQSTPTTGLDLIAMIAAEAARKQAPQQQQLQKQQQRQQNQNALVQLRPRPASVSLNCSRRVPTPSAAPSAASANKPKKMLANSSFQSATESDVAGLVDVQTIQKLERMASGTNLRILKRANSHHPTTATLTQTQPGLAFQPNFNSWTNFSFNKNFMANVFVKS